MAIYLHEKVAPRIEKIFKERSVVKSRFANRYSFDGVRTIKVMSLETSPLTDYVRSGANRYGTPSEVEDTYQSITLQMDKAFSKTIDKGNQKDQGGLKAAGTFLSLQIQEQYIPAYDKWVLNMLATRGGTIAGESTALTKSNVIGRISAAMTVLDDAEVPAEGRTIFVPAKVFDLIRMSDEFIKIEPMGMKGIKNGMVGDLFGASVVKVPKGRWPENVNYIIAHKDSAVCAEKIHDTKIHQDPPGISGNLIEGRFYWGGDVLMAKANGIYVEVDTGSGKGTVLGTTTIAASGGAFSGVSGATYWYTTDGSDPRYSGTRKTGTAPDVTSSGTVVKAYATKAGAFDGPVSTQILT